MADMSRRPIVLEPQGENNDDRNRRGGYEIEGSTARTKFREFFRNFRQGNVYIYREALIRNWYTCEYVYIYMYTDIYLYILMYTHIYECKYLCI
jgi:hypothetical protein